MLTRHTRHNSRVSFGLPLYRSVLRQSPNTTLSQPDRFSLFKFGLLRCVASPCSLSGEFKNTEVESSCLQAYMR